MNEMTPGEFLYILNDRVRYVNHRTGPLKLPDGRFLLLPKAGLFRGSGHDDDGHMFDIEINCMNHKEKSQDITLVHEIYHIRDEFLYDMDIDEESIENRAVKFYKENTELVRSEADLSKRLRQDEDKFLVKV